MRSMSRAVVLACLVAVAGSAGAQPPGGGRGGRGGPGGPGGGGVLSLFRSKTVQDEMKFTDEQKDKLREAVPKLQDSAREKFQALFGGGGRPDPAKMTEIQGEVAAMTDKELGAILTPEQLKRLKQIEIQVAGMRAYQLPQVTEAMKFTDDQKSKMQEIGGETFKEMRELATEYDLQAPWMRPTDPEKAAEFDKKQAKINKDAAAKIDELLTDDQKAKFKELSGPTIDAAKVRAESAQPKKKKADD